jgi:hypothetical protein
VGACNTGRRSGYMTELGESGAKDSIGIRLGDLVV